MSVAELLGQELGSFSDLLHARALEHGDRTALVCGDQALTYAELDAVVERVAASLQRDGLQPGEVVAICVSGWTMDAIAALLGAVRAGGAAAPIPTSLAPRSLVLLLKDSGARVAFFDAKVWEPVKESGDEILAKRIALDGSDAGEAFSTWLAPVGTRANEVAFDPDRPFNIIYSSGTTGVPKGIVHAHRMRWRQLRGLAYGADAVSLVSLSIYSNMALLSLLPTLTHGGTAVVMAKFDVGEFLRLAEDHRVTHAMMVPVQVHRILEHPDFDRRDLSSFRMKHVAGAPFSVNMKSEVLRRWPGGLQESYGMTEGGGATGLAAHEFPHKLHTVGRPGPGTEIRIIDEDGREVALGELGEVVGRSDNTMQRYHNQPERSREIEWVSPDGLTFIRTGDLGKLDEDGFLQLVDRKKDMIISGGFNIYPSDLEAEMIQHPQVLEAAVVGVASDKWGETPVAFVALKPGATVTADELKAWTNGKLGKTQRLADLILVDSLPRSHIGKVLKRELRDDYKGVALTA
ncbi:MAG: class I adenylate-forming enzyme family protein [Phenylobacterium sp.]|uniref:class I adenylate-forming enzyme family protein n=1 Tax=Phenylobacterium sp. TaxID=1871053 RepID=UPI002735FBF5|nr:class I adenylate-forming enzyme family protein [Phenylobacterium sp.]MDP3099054.1 class I adenylate-forming enzyme family protein [Phenylobacterium sp.]